MDLSPVPLSYAAFNARRLGVGDRLTTLQVNELGTGHIWAHGPCMGWRSWSPALAVCLSLPPAQAIG